MKAKNAKLAAPVLQADKNAVSPVTLHTREQQALRAKLDAQLRMLDAKIALKTLATRPDASDAAQSAASAKNAPPGVSVSSRAAPRALRGSFSAAASIQHYADMGPACPCEECRKHRRQYPNGAGRVTVRSPRWGRLKPGQCW